MDDLIFLRTPFNDCWRGQPLQLKKESLAIHLGIALLGKTWSLAKYCLYSFPRYKATKSVYKEICTEDEIHKTMVNCIGVCFHPNLLKRKIWKVTWNCVQKTKKKTVTSIIVVSIFSRLLTCCGTPSWVVLPFIFTSFTCWVNVFFNFNKAKKNENFRKPKQYNFNFLKQGTPDRTNTIFVKLMYTVCPNSCWIGIFLTNYMWYDW